MDGAQQAHEEGRGDANVRQILKEDLKKRKRDYRTILTFVSRIAAKGFLEVEKEGNTNYDTPAVPQKKGLQREIDRFLKEVVEPELENLELVAEALRRKLSRGRPCCARGRPFLTHSGPVANDTSTASPGAAFSIACLSSGTSGR